MKSNLVQIKKDMFSTFCVPNQRTNEHTPLLFPVDGGVVHLVDNDDQSTDTSGLDELSMLSGLTSFIETSLELSLSSGDDLKIREGQQSLAAHSIESKSQKKKHSQAKRHRPEQLH